jgi:hypothetical protein
MSRLLNLYPAAWRERYGAELQDLTIPLGLVWLAIGALAVLRPTPTPTRA